MVIAIDPGDIMKPYVIAMEKLCGVEVPSFFQYAMADGVFELLKKARTGIDDILFKGKTGKSSDNFQLSLFPY